MLKDVENDEVYKAVKRNSIAGPNIDRLTSYDRLANFDTLGRTNVRRGSTVSVLIAKPRVSTLILTVLV
jgi:hypothetical protein